LLSAPDDPEPLAVTDPVLELQDGTLMLTAEVNKSYEDRAPWRQRVVSLRSSDGGKTWSPPQIRFQDPAGRIFFWDQHSALNTRGQIVAFTWIYDHFASQYLNISRTISPDGGQTWSPPDDLGFADQ